MTDNIIPLRPKTIRKRKESDLVGDIRSALGRLTYCVVWRNNTGVLPDARGIPVTYGLCKGSSDLVGIVECSLRAPVQTRLGRPEMHWTVLNAGRFFAIECKQPGKHATEDQERFLAIVRRYGGAAVCVDNLQDALDFIEKARRLEV